MKYRFSYSQIRTLRTAILFCSIIILSAGCEKEMHKPGYVNELLGRWQCIGFGNSETELFREIEPQDCEDCYRFSFRTDSLFVGKTYWNGMNWRYEIKSDSIKFTDYLTTLVNEEHDTETFINAIFNSYSYQLIDSTELRLYYVGDTFNYLLFVKCEPIIRI